MFILLFVMQTSSLNIGFPLLEEKKVNFYSLKK